MCTRRTSSPYRIGAESLALSPLPIRKRRNLARFDLAAATPEHIRVAHDDTGFFEMPVNGGFVRKQHLFVRAVGDAHDVDVMELRAAFTPVGVRHDVMPADFPARVNL